MSITIDLETTAITPDAGILRIAAVKFNTSGGNPGIRSIFDLGVSLDSQHARKVCANTMKWWDGQPTKVKEEAFSGVCPIHEALEHLSSYIGDKDELVWVRGATFDPVILQDAYSELGMELPFKYYKVHEIRTLEMTAVRLGIKRAPRPPEGLAHTALGDARYQAEQVIYYQKELERLCKK